MKATAILLLFTSCAALAATEQEVRRKFDVAPGGKLVLEVDFGSVELRSDGTVPQVNVDVWRKVTRRSKQDEDFALRMSPVEFVQQGNNVTIRARSKEEQRWFTGGETSNQGKYVIRVPALYNAEIETAGGSVSVIGVIGTVSAQTSGGRIEVNGGGGTFKGETAGGDVVVKGYQGPISVQTSGGAINLENVSGKVKGSTAGGSITAILPAPVPGEVSLATSGGDVVIKVPEKTGFNLEARTSGGDVRSELPVTTQGEVDSTRLTGMVNAGGPPVKLRTSGGVIRIKKM